MAGLVQTFCTKMLSQTSKEFLQGLCTEYAIVVEANKREDKDHLLKVVLRHLVSEAVENSPDNGAALFLKLYNDLGGELETLEPKKEPSMPPLEGDAVSELSYHKLRQFKINGTIGDPGQKGCLSYSNLCYQISQGESDKYTTREIYGGVIRAIEAGNPFREVLELEVDDFDKEAFMKSIRSHFSQRDPNAIKNELRIATQGPKETAHRFVCRCIALKKRIVKISNDEELTVDLVGLSSTFFKAVHTGLRQNNVRNELRQILKDQAIGDDDLLVEVAAAAASEEERLRKLGEEKKVSVNLLTYDSDSDEPYYNPSSSDPSSASASEPCPQKNSRASRKSKAKAGKNASQKDSDSPQNRQNSDTLFVAEVSKITAAIDKLSTSQAQLTADVMALKQFSANSHKPRPPSVPNVPTIPQNNGNVLIGSDGNPMFNPTLNVTAPAFQRPQQQTPQFPPYNPTAPVLPQPQIRHNRFGRPVYMCDNCIAANMVYCRHCFKCGSDVHKVKDCPLN